MVISDRDLARYEQMADASGVTLSEWVRQALGKFERELASGEVEVKLAAIRRAVAHETDGREVEIETMLAETESGRLLAPGVGTPGVGRASAEGA